MWAKQQLCTELNCNNCQPATTISKTTGQTEAPDFKHRNSCAASGSVSPLTVAVPAVHELSHEISTDDAQCTALTSDTIRFLQCCPTANSLCCGHALGGANMHNTAALAVQTPGPADKTSNTTRTELTWECIWTQHVHQAWHTNNTKSCQRNIPRPILSTWPWHR